MSNKQVWLITGSSRGLGRALAETVLLGTAAFRSGKELDWDAANLKATNTNAADQFIRQAEYRKGWGMDILTTL